MSFRLTTICYCLLLLVMIANALSNATLSLALNVEINNVFSLEINGINAEQLDNEKVDSDVYAFQIFSTISSLLQAVTLQSDIALSHLTHRLFRGSRGPPSYCGNSIYLNS